MSRDTVSTEPALPGPNPAEIAPPDRDLAARLVAAQFPQWADLPVRDVEHSGWDNRTFRLGDSLTLRLPRAAAYAGQVAKEQQWLPVLAPRLPVPVPRPVARGRPGPGYPYPWSVHAWLDGEPATTGRIADPVTFATAVAEFLVALRGCDPTGGPPPGQHNWWRGDPLTRYVDEACQALASVRDEVDEAAATAVLERAVASAWAGPAVWFHGDVAVGNLLVRGGRLAAVIDFGSSGVGDPACDTVLAWTLLLGTARRAYATTLELDPATWSRGRGWALWKALITLAGSRDTDVVAADDARRVIAEVLADPVR